MNRALRAKLGFSLVELMIVVAIIGVLATIGVPTFRTMVQKAKKSEAKVAMGALYTAEAAFFSEYGVYGNQVNRIGFELDGSSLTRIYTSGFFGASCSAAASAVQPAQASVGSALNLSFPGYYAAGGSALVPGKVANASSACSGFDVATGATSFVAAAGGIIGKSTTITDVWTINEQRQLSNSVDGTN